MKRQKIAGWQRLGLVAASALVVGACGSSKPAATNTASSSSASYSIGLMTDETGISASAFKSTVQGVEAGVGLARSEGYDLKLTVVDTGSSPAGALSAAQKLVAEDHVGAVLAISGFTFAAAPYLTAHGVPVVGDQVDAEEWLAPTSTNMFSVDGTDDFTKVTSTLLNFFKTVGATTVGAIGYGISPSSADGVKALALGAPRVGLRVGFTDPEFAYGGTNVGPDAIKMKSTGVTGIENLVVPSTAFALATALKQEGADVKADVLSTGYGGDLTNSGAAGEQAAQGDYFTVPFEPVEMHTAATIQLQNALKKYAGVTSDPTFDEYVGYVSVDAVVQGLKAAGRDPSAKAMIAALSGIHDYQADGLFGGAQSIDFGTKAMPAKSCDWVTQFEGTSFYLVPGADPVCGSVIPGLTVGS